MGNSLKRPGDPRSPCIAMLRLYDSSLQLVNLDGKVSDEVKISDEWPHGMVTINGEVYVVTQRKIFKILPDGKKTKLAELPYEVDSDTHIVTFQSQIYIVQPRGKKMLRFNPADETLNDDLAGYPLDDGFCCCASDSLIYAMGGRGTETSAVEYNPHTNMWTEIAPMQHGRVGASSVVMNNRVYVLGSGWNDPASECYDPHSGTWCEMPNMNVQVRFRCALIIGNNLYAINNGSIEVYDGRGWRLVTRWKGRDFHCCCIWPYDSVSTSDNRDQPSASHVDHIEDASSSPDKTPEAVFNKTSQDRMGEEVQDEIDQLQANHVSKKTESVRKLGGCIGLPGTRVKIPEGAVREEKKITFSTQTVTGEENGLIDITPRLHNNSPDEFLKPVSVTMETFISAPAGRSIPATLHHRNHPDEEWKEKEELSIGDRKEVNFKIHGGGETKIAINLKKLMESLGKKLGKWKANIAEFFKIRVHQRVDFYINEETGVIAVTLSKDENTHNLTKQTLCERVFAPFSVLDHEVIAPMGSEVLFELKCEAPEEGRISDRVFPSSTIKMDRSFMEKDRHEIYFELDPRPTAKWREIKTLFSCTIDGLRDHVLPLFTKWPPTERRNKVASPTTQQNFYNSFHGAVGFGNAKVTDQSSGSRYVAGQDQHIDQSTTAGKIYHGQGSTSSSHENINVSRKLSGLAKDGQSVNQSVAAGFIINGQADVKIDDGNINVTHN